MQGSAYLSDEERVLLKRSNVYCHKWPKGWGHYGTLILSQTHLLFPIDYRKTYAYEERSVSVRHTMRSPPPAKTVVGIPLTDLRDVKVENRIRKKGSPFYSRTLFRRQKYKVLVISVNTSEGTEQIEFEMIKPETGEPEEVAKIIEKAIRACKSGTNKRTQVADKSIKLEISRQSQLSKLGDDRWSRGTRVCPRCGGEHMEWSSSSGCWRCLGCGYAEKRDKHGRIYGYDFGRGFRRRS